MIVMVLPASCARASGAAASPTAAISSCLLFILILLVLIVHVTVVVVVHQLLRYAGNELARGRRGGADPLDAALLARRFAQVVEREQGRILRDFQALGERGKEQLAHLAPVPSVAH